MKKPKFPLSTRKFILYWLPVFVWASVIFWFSSRQAQATSQIYWEDFIVKKTAHITEYGIFTILLFRGFKNTGLSITQSIKYTFIIAVTYALSDEFHQSFTPGREPTLRDVIFDTIGASLAIFVIWKLLPKAPKKLRHWAEKLDLV